MRKTGSTIVYLYDHNGLRTSKAVTENNATITTNYIYNGNFLVHMTKGADTLHFYYDAQGRAAMVNYNGMNYHYLHNLQGDIIGIADSNGNLVCEYHYGPWGEPRRRWYRTGYLDLLNLNPLRYRGYVYDTETGLYYLQSRYYSYTWGRFISADAVLGQTGQILGHNVFCYVNNTPTMFLDSNGHEAILFSLFILGEISGLFGFLGIAIAYPGITNSTGGWSIPRQHRIPNLDDARKTIISFIVAGTVAIGNQLIEKVRNFLGKKKLTHITL